MDDSYCRVLGQLVDQCISVVDRKLEQASSRCIDNLRKIGGLIDFYDEDITQRSDGLKESAEKRRIHVKREVMNKKSLILDMTKSFLPCTLSVHTSNAAASAVQPSALHIDKIMINSPMKGAGGNTGAEQPQQQPSLQQQTQQPPERSANYHLDTLVDEYIESIDKAITVSQRELVNDLGRLVGEIEYFESEITSRLDRQVVPESAEKRQVFVKREVLQRRSEMVRVAKNFMEVVLPLGFNEINDDNDKEEEEEGLKQKNLKSCAKLTGI